jgi:3'-phosphoadenosine 5'-phosphosulfate sulfotransferase (PAPS reductase)/FAD synthetase
MTKERIKEWYNYWNGNVYISFSGGKDSTVLLHIVRELYSDVSAVFVNTGLEYPEIRDFVKTIDNVIWLRPKMNFKKVIETYGYPIISKEQAGWIKDYQIGGTQKRRDRIYKVSKKWQYLKDAPFKISDECCNKIKKEPIKKYEKETGQKGILGNLACEGVQRERNYLKTGCNSFESKRPLSMPLGFWTDNDILRYLQNNNILYSEIYGDIIELENGDLTTTKEKRTGCIFCMFGVHLDKEPNRFQRLKQTHSKLYDYCIHKLGLGNVLDYINVKY